MKRNILPAAGTFSKDTRAFWGTDPDAQPREAVLGLGSRVLCNDGKWYTDWIGALGANLLGYQYEGFNEHVAHHTVGGNSFSLPTQLEYKVAEQLVDTLGLYVPGWLTDDLMVRYAKTGTECTMAAVRLARAVTGRDLILRCSDSYLGWSDTFIATTPPALGVPGSYKIDTRLFKYGQDPDTFSDAIRKEQEYDEDNGYSYKPDWYLPACVILEQGLAEPPDGWYKKLRKWCDDNGTLLILDETASGFRYGLGGAAEKWNIEPDLATYGKALGNGYSIAALVGKVEYMEWFARQSPVFVSGTFCGEVSGLAAANFVLNVLNKPRAYETPLWVGGLLLSGLKDIFSKTPYQVVGHDARFIILWPSDEYQAWFLRGMAQRGVLCNRPFYTSFSHTVDDVDKTLSAAQEVIDTMPETFNYKSWQLPRVLFRNR